MAEPVRIGVNGFGRIGRSFLRALWSRADVRLEAVAVNDVLDTRQLAYLFEFDSVSGRWVEPVRIDGDRLVVGQRTVRLLQAPDPSELPWAELGVRVVIESSRVFGPAAKARGHLGAGADLVLVSAPSEGADATLVVGVNDADFDPARHRVVSNASCTTNCLAAMAKVLNDTFGIETAMMTTVHAYTSDQALVDGARGTGRDSRAGALNVIPSSTGAARALGLVLPELAGSFSGSSLRVPVGDGSITDLTALLGATPSRDDVITAFKAASRGSLAGVLDYSEDQLVSSDVVGRTASCIFDAPLTQATGRLVKVFGWYDNEWGYANRLVDLADRLGRRLPIRGRIGAGARP